jgi:tetratricopeptide (TPR) repeat protein
MKHTSSVHRTNDAIATGIAIGLVFLSGGDLARAATCDPSAATLVSLQGVVEAKAVGSSQWQAVSMNEEFCPGDSVRTQPESRADLLLGDQSVLRVREQTTLVVEGPDDSNNSYVLDLLQGAAHFFSRQGARNLNVETPYAVAGVRGTEFGVEVADGGTTVRVFEGSVLTANDAGSVILADGQTAFAEKGKAPVSRTEVRPRDAVRWTLYYPPVIHRESGAPTDANQAEANRSAQRASQLLAVGSVDAASRELESAIETDPDNADALALQSILALVQNDKQAAVRLSDEAVAADSSSATALLAQSYVRQSGFDLDGARQSLELATEKSPDNALVWARLAEIRSSLGDTRGTLSAAKRAAALDPDLSLTQTVLGFAELARVNTDEAAAAFEKAIESGPADPLSTNESTPRQRSSTRAIRHRGFMTRSRNRSRTGRSKRCATTRKRSNLTTTGPFTARASSWIRTSRREAPPSDGSTATWAFKTLLSSKDGSRSTLTMATTRPTDCWPIPTRLCRDTKSHA